MRPRSSDSIDGDSLLRVLLAFKRGEPRVCSMVKPPTPEQEDHRCIGRERKTLIGERVAHVNRVNGVLFTLELAIVRRCAAIPDNGLKVDGRPSLDETRQLISRELDRLELCSRTDQGG